MQIYQQEITDGLEEKIKSTASVSYASIVTPSSSSSHNTKNIKALASISDDDLY
jgi:hypothetical protein